MSRTDKLNEVDRIHEIERHIAHLLSHGESAVVDKGTIENGYSILDATQGEMTGTVHEKCAAVISVLKDKYSIDAEYSILDGTIRFCPFAPCGHQGSTSESAT